MDRIVKNQLLELTELIKEGHRRLKVLLEREEINDAAALLSECQDGAVLLGTIVEENVGEGVEAIGILEEYCEGVFQVHQALFQSNKPEIDAGYIRMEELLECVRESLKNDIQTRREVVFLPYKASMWDSLESVWMEEKDNPHCDTYVIPIPYFDRSADGSFGEMHYEGNQYPENVPITDYSIYDFLARRPDAIYIHNPYDEHNTVTSVHPFFYAKNLKKYTECLVYIPYFILEEVDPRNKAAVDGIEHFVTVSGVIHADKVIVQSEKMRQVYIDVMSREAGEHTRELWERKIYGTGSPKLDKIQRTKKTDIQIPQEWQRLLYKGDGSVKKVILYNTGVTALLQHEEKMLDKIRRVFEVFKQYQNEVVLLWRPHPLMKATIQSMRPQLQEAYETIVSNYRNEGWGIYDDTADMDRALVLCDAYYGDHSSLVQLCQKSGKAIMIQEVNI